MNKLELIGRLTKDVEVKESKKGTKYANFTLAVQRKAENDKTDFIECIAFGNIAEVISKYVEKGNRILVEGTLNIDVYEDKEGKKQKQVKCIVDDFYFIDFKKELSHE